MSLFKSHFQFSKKQRSGIFLLLVIIFVAQCIYFFVEIPPSEVSIDEEQLKQFRTELDSLRLVEIESNKPKTYPFNPNFITDYKGYTLGMSNEEIDRLLNFRAQNKWINSAQQFQEVTQVSDSLLVTIAPYFKFPEWVTKPKPKLNINKRLPKSYSEKTDLNKATVIQLQSVNGVGEKLSQRIINYRDKFKEKFLNDIQLQDVYGLSPEVIERITNEFTVKTIKHIRKLNLNTATKDELVIIRYIDYELAHQIIEQRTLREGFTSWNELTKVKDFPIDKIDRFKLYLSLN